MSTPTQELKAEYKKRFANNPPQTAPAQFDDFVIYSLHALADGNATPHQQKKILEWIINHASRANGMHYTEKQSDKDFSMGRAFVGQQMLELMRIPMMNLPPDTTPPERPPTPPETKPLKKPKKEK